MAAPFPILLADLVLPARCLSCGLPLLGGRPDGAAVCDSCRTSLVFLPEPRCRTCGRPLSSESGTCMACRAVHRGFDEAWPLYDYRGTAGRLIAAYKFGARTALSGFLADRLAPVIDARWPGWTLVPVPPRRKALRARGWDQVELLARRLEAKGHVVARVLERGPSREQKTLGLEERRANASMAYRMRMGARSPCRALLLDDVFTTGATAEACARALTGAGAESVAFVALAAD